MNNFNENTRVQVPAALHLCKLGYTYLDEEVDKIVNTFLDKQAESHRLEEEIMKQLNQLHFNGQ